MAKLGCSVEGCNDVFMCKHPSDPACERTKPLSPLTTSTKIEAVNHPSHYGGDSTYETIKVIAAWKLGFLLGNCVKYVSRAGKKDPAKLVEDLRKAHWYLGQAITRLERGEALY